MTWTDVQLRRLKELDADTDTLAARFDDTAERNRSFQKMEKRLAARERERLEALLTDGLRPRLLKLEARLAAALNREGFTQVTTPILMSRAALAKMSIDDGHPLAEQVYWVDRKHCLRPMLAPNLYSLMIDLGRLKTRPIRFFEIGPCFRKESDGAHHNSEFTMLNLVEMGLPEPERHGRLRKLGALVAEAAGLRGWRFADETSEVYGDTVDILVGDADMEVASGAMGPHPLDEAWRITETWVGLGFGLERLLMAAEGGDSIGRWGRSLAYLDGIRLNLPGPGASANFAASIGRDTQAGKVSASRTKRKA
jgi:phenylalanyl-tRNA synthetase alpha chain